MKIAIDIRSIPYPQISGVGNYCYYAIKNILAQDKTNEYILFGTGLKKDAYQWLDFHQPNVKLKIVNQANKLINLRFILGQGPDFEDLLGEKVDLIWLPNPNFFYSRSQTPLVLTVHDLAFWHQANYFSLKRRLWHRLINLPKLLNRASTILAVSKHTKSEIQKYFHIADDKIQVIYPGVNTKAAEIRTDTSNVLKELPNKYFLFIGTIEPRKNILAILKAFALFNEKFPEYKLMVAGNLGWNYKKILSLLKSQKNVQYLSYISENDKFRLYSCAQGLIWPSFYEGFGFPPLEAAGSNIPLILSYKSSLAEVATTNAIYVDPYNVKEITAVLWEIANNNMQQMDIYSKNTVIIPSWPKQAEEIMLCFKKFNL